MAQPETALHHATAWAHDAPVDGTRMIVVVNPRRRSVTVYRPDRPTRFLSEQDELSGDDVVPGWTIRVQDLFR